MEVVGNYAIVRDLCEALQAGRTVRPVCLEKVGQEIVPTTWRKIYPLRRLTGALVFCTIDESTVSHSVGGVYVDAYEAAAAFVRKLPSRPLRLKISPAVER